MKFKQSSLVEDQVKINDKTIGCRTMQHWELRIIRSSNPIQIKCSIIRMNLIISFVPTLIKFLISLKLSVI